MGIHLRQDGTRSSEGSDAVIRIENVNALGGVTGLSLGVPNTEFVAHFGTLVVKRIAKYRTRDAWTESETPRESPKSPESTCASKKAALDTLAKAIRKTQANPATSSRAKASRAKASAGSVWSMYA